MSGIVSGTGILPVSEVENMGGTPMLRGTGILPVVPAQDMGGTPMPQVCSTGILPVNSKPHGQNAHATLHIRQGAYLPHWTREGAVYAVTFRLGDSLPRPVLESWVMERRNIVLTAEQMKRPLSEDENNRLLELHSERVEDYLDAGHGTCWLRQPAIAQLVVDALRHFDHQRYRLHAWCVMPNHVHVIVEPLTGQELPALLHSWKSFTAKAANGLLKRTGEFWQKEYYDHLIRDAEDYAHAMHYLLNNPGKAGIKNWPWVWSGTGILPVNEEENMGGTPMPQKCSTGILPVIPAQDMGGTPMPLSPPNQAELKERLK